jgi:hypothetical protein
MACPVAQHNRPTIHCLTNTTRPDHQETNRKSWADQRFIHTRHPMIKIKPSQDHAATSIRGLRLSLNPPMD